MINVHFSKKTDEWATPKYIYQQAEKMGLYDPCPLGGDADGLSLDWGQACFVNPPYSDLRNWVSKSIEEAKKGKRVLMLIPARTDTKAFKQLFEYGSRFFFVQGRLRFNEAKCAPFPSMIVNLCGGGISKIEILENKEIDLGKCLERN